MPRFVTRLDGVKREIRCAAQNMFDMDARVMGDPCQYELHCVGNQQSTPSPNTRERILTDKVEHGTRESALGRRLFLGEKCAHTRYRPRRGQRRRESETGERTHLAAHRVSGLAGPPGTSTCPTPTPDSRIILPYSYTTAQYSKLTQNSRARSAHHAPATQTVQPGDGPGYLSGRRAALLHLLHERRHLVRVRGLLIVRDENLPDDLLLLAEALQVFGAEAVALLRLGEG